MIDNSLFRFFSPLVACLVLFFSACEEKDAGTGPGGNNPPLEPSVLPTKAYYVTFKFVGGINTDTIKVIDLKAAGQPQQTIATLPNAEINGMVLSGDFLYFTDSKNKRIARVSKAGGAIQDVFTNLGDTIPQDIAVAAGKVYWSGSYRQNGTSGPLLAKIYSGNADGTGTKAAILGGQQYPVNTSAVSGTAYSFNLTVQDNQIFFCAANQISGTSSIIYKANIGATTATQIATFSPPISGITADNNNVYFTSRGQAGVFTVSKNGGTPVELFGNSSDNVSGPEFVKLLNNVLLWIESKDGNDDFIVAGDKAGQTRQVIKSGILTEALRAVLAVE